ncbi:hypothetical protein [Stenotrophomonas sp. AB1(2024)]|uniref:hypothetical protein n=1 Tax=Stenotrophomonas sp. AB1(2024) TaxID=3132215 RepID=UPI0030ADB436
MNKAMCHFFAGSVAEWLMLVVTLFTGIAVAVLAYQANNFTKRTKAEVDASNARRARVFGYMISTEVGGAQSAFYNIRKALEIEVDNARIPNLDNIRLAARNVSKSFLPSVTQSIGNVDLLPESCAVPLLGAVASIENARRCLEITLEAPVNVEGNILTPVGMNNIDRVVSLLMSAEIRFQKAHRALWQFNFPTEPITEWQYPADAILPPPRGADASGGSPSRPRGLGP